MLRMPMESELRGQSLDVLLGVNSLKLESVIELIKQGEYSVKELKLAQVLMVFRLMLLSVGNIFQMIVL